MKNQKLVIIVLAVVILMIVGGAIWLASAPLMPPAQKVEQAVPDDRIPH